MLFRAYLGPFGTFLSPKSTQNSQKVKTWVKKEEKKGDVPVKATVGGLEVSRQKKTFKKNERLKFCQDDGMICFKVARACTSVLVVP